MLLCKRTAKKKTSSSITTVTTPVSNFARDGGSTTFDVMPGGGVVMGLFANLSHSDSCMLKLVHCIYSKNCEIPECLDSLRILEDEYFARIRNITSWMSPWHLTTST